MKLLSRAAAALLAAMRRTRWLAAAALALVGVTPCAASDHGAATHEASAHGAPAHGAPAAEGHGAAEEVVVRTDVLDLGEFTLENFRPTHNEVTSIRFKLILKLAPETSVEMVHRLGHWRRRLRDQAIIAVRSVAAADLADPKLVRVQRLILTRIKRLPFTDLIEAAYVTEFEVGIE